MCDLVTENYDEGIDIGRKSTLTELEKEIDTINNEIALIRNESIEQDIKNATSTLDSLKSFSEEVLDLIRYYHDSNNVYLCFNITVLFVIMIATIPINFRLITTSQNARSICSIPTNQQLTNRGFENARNLFKKSNISSRVTTENRITTKMKIIEKPKHGYNKGYNVKFGKFVMKKRSLISLRFDK